MSLGAPARILVLPICNGEDSNMLRRIILIICIISAIGVCIPWYHSYSRTDSRNLPELPHDCAWGFWMILECGRLQGCHARIPLIGGYRIYLKGEDGIFSVALISPFEWQPTTTEIEREAFGFGFERWAVSPPTREQYWDLIDCQDRSTYDDLFVIVKFPAWFALLILVAYPIYAFIQGPIVHHLRYRKGLCPNCGYNLQGHPNETRRCPECSEHSQAPRQKQHNPLHQRLLFIAIIPAAIGLIIMAGFRISLAIAGMRIMDLWNTGSHLACSANATKIGFVAAGSVLANVSIIIALFTVIYSIILTVVAYAGRDAKTVKAGVLSVFLSLTLGLLAVQLGFTIAGL